MADLERRVGGVRIARRVLKVTGLGESALDDIIAPIYKEYTNPSTTILFTDSEIEIHLTGSADTAGRAEELVGELTDKLEEKLGYYLYTTTGESLEEVVGHRLRLKQFTIATAESCTGGLVAERITRVPGSSDYFAGSVVTYTSDAKARLLGVAEEMIERHGP